MKIELFYSPGCSKCSAAQAALKAVAQDAVHDIEWRELNILDETDYAVELGVLSLPSIAIDGKLVFTSMPAANELREALMRRAAGQI